MTRLTILDDYHQPTYRYLAATAHLHQVAQEPLRSCMPLPCGGAEETLGSLEVLGKAFLSRANQVCYLKRNVFIHYNLCI